jgi:hypothetical protein
MKRVRSPAGMVPLQTSTFDSFLADTDGELAKELSVVSRDEGPRQRPRMLPLTYGEIPDDARHRYCPSRQLSHPF